MIHADTIESHFRAIVAALDGALRPGERYAATYDGEDTDFVRLNRGKVRQPGHVSQRYLGLRLVQGRRHAQYRLSLRGDLAADIAAASAALGDLRGALADATDDPLLLLPDTVQSSTVTRGGHLPPAKSRYRSPRPVRSQAPSPRSNARGARAKVS